MIQRPQKRIGGSIGLEIDAIWQAMARLEVRGGGGLEVDQTTSGTVVRVALETVATELPAGAFFKITSVGLGAAFNAIEADSAGNPSSFIMSGLCGSGRMMESPTTRLPPLGLSYDATYGTDEHELVWDFATAGATGYTEAIPNTGDVVFAVRSALEKNFTGHNASGAAIVENKVFWYVLPTTQAAPPPPQEHVFISIESVGGSQSGDPIPQPAFGVAIHVGDIIALNVVAHSTPLGSLYYEWYRDSTLVSTSASEFITATLADSGLYQCIVRTGVGGAFASTTPVPVTVTEP